MNEEKSDAGEGRGGGPGSVSCLSVNGKEWRHASKDDRRTKKCSNSWELKALFIVT